MRPAESKAAAYSPELRSFGRRRGRKLSQRQERLFEELLPRVAVDASAPPIGDARSLFPAGTS
ncbi:MAG: tRNA (guanosine(46)-N7)-methyltransferase TrmB, partial [Hyphomicrobium sp.]